MANLQEQIAAFNNREKFHSRGFNLFEESVSWFYQFKRDLQKPREKQKWAAVDTFVVIPVDVKNEHGLYNTLMEYSINQTLDKAVYALVLFLNSKDGENTLKPLIDKFQAEHPEVNLTYYFHKFNDAQIKKLNIATIRNTGYNFVFFASRYLNKRPSKTVLVGADADTLKVSTNFLAQHRLSTKLNEGIGYCDRICTSSKWVWGLTGDLSIDFYLILNQMQNDVQEIKLQNSQSFVNSNRYPPEATSSFSLETYERVFGLDVNSVNVGENHKLIDMSAIAKIPMFYSTDTYIVSHSRRAIHHIRNGGDKLDINQIWSGGWESTGDTARENQDLPINPTHSAEVNTELKKIVAEVYQSKFIEVFIDEIAKERDFEDLVNKIARQLDISEDDQERTTELSPEGKELKDVTYNVLLQIFLVTIRKAVLETGEILKKFTYIKPGLDLEAYLQRLLDNDTFLNAVQLVFQSLLLSPHYQSVAEEIYGDAIEEANEQNEELKLRPLHESVELLIAILGVVTNKTIKHKQADILFGSIYGLEHPLNGFIDFDQFYKTIKRYQSVQLVSNQT